MKKYIVFVTLFISIFAYSQAMNIHKTNGLVDNCDLSEIDSITFTIPSSELTVTELNVTELTVTDIDVNVYSTVTIGTQVWMAENLKVTHYRNGEPIPKVTDNTEWCNLTTGAYCNYDNDANNATTYGSLYNWYAVDDSRNIAPAGWHVPTDEEWQTLVDYLGGSGVAGGKLKETGTTHWKSPNEGATNESGFSALPGGYHFHDGGYSSMGSSAAFWSSSDYISFSGSFYALGRALLHDYSKVYRHGYDERYGYSVRCVRD